MQLSTVANRLCNHPAFEQHAAQLQQDAALCDGLVRLLIDAYAAVARQSQKMASEGAELEWPVVVELALALDSEPLRPAAQALACAAAGGDSDATASLDRQLEVSAQLLQLATTAGTADELGAAQLHLAEQLGHAAWRSCLAVRLRQQAARLPNLQPDGRQELQQARFLLPLVPRMARLLEAAHDEAASAAGKAAGAAGNAGNAAGVAGAAGADSSSTADSSAINSEAARLANAFDGLLHHLQLATLCNELGSGTDSGSDADSGSETSVEVWCEVACIAMQALPTLVAVAPLLAGADVDAVGGPTRHEAGDDQAADGDQAGLDEKRQEQGQAHASRSTASSMARSRAAASSGVRRWPKPSRAVAALAADPAKKVSIMRCRAPAATVSVRGTGR